METVFPELGDPEFQQKISRLQEYQLYSTPALPTFTSHDQYLAHVQNVCNDFEKTVVQGLTQHYLSKRSPYRGLILFHGLGVGKTCSAITFAESMLADGDAQIWVVMSETLQKSFKRQLFDITKMDNPLKMMQQCVGDSYYRMAQIMGPWKDDTSMKDRMNILIKERYKMLTYDAFYNEIENSTNVPNNITLIVDEAHNARTTDNDVKKITSALKVFAEKGQNNRIVFLTATPMYDNTAEIFDLLEILCKNDKLKTTIPTATHDEQGNMIPETRDWLKQMASQYISYIRGVNPFTFATRLSPIDSGFASEMVQLEGIPLGIVVSPMHPDQAKLIERTKNNTTKLEWTNVGVSESLFQQKDGPVRSIEYRPKYKNALMPSPELGKIAPKINTICRILQKSEGIVVIYSQFIANGILPMAVALEHMGFTHYQRKSNLVVHDSADKTKTLTKYPNIPYPNYAILTKDNPDILGQSIDELLKAINDPKNAHGERIKVVLMTPVAHEGISLRNVREVHILDPWYNMSRLEQVIGRAIRTCSHTDLPLEERNVTVFLHASGDMDMSTYQIAAGKEKKIREVTELIRDHAMDCSIQKHVNYFPKSLFEFEVSYRTSQQVVVTKHLGDDPKEESRCPPLSTTDDASFRPSVVAELVRIGLQRLRKYIMYHMKQGNQVRYTRRELMENAIRMHPMVAENVLKEAMRVPFFPEHRFYSHQKGMYFIEPLQNQVPKKETRIFIQESAVPETKTVTKTKTKTKTEPVQPSQFNLEVEKEMLDMWNASKKVYDKFFDSTKFTEDKVFHTCWLWTHLERSQWGMWGRAIVRGEVRVNKNTEMYLDCLEKQGALVTSKELTKSGHGGRKHVGYMDIFMEEPQGEWFDQTIFTEKDIDAIKRKRVLRAPPKPPKERVGVLVALKDGIRFKLQSQEHEKGIVCTSKQIDGIQEWLTHSKVENNRCKTKESKCLLLMMELLKKDKLFLTPYMKPKPEAKP